MFNEQGAIEMQTVELVRAETGAKKVSCTTTLQTHCHLSLTAAKIATDALLEGKYPKVSLASDDAGRKLIIALAKIGIVARFAEGPNYNPQERLAATIAPLRSVFPPDAIRTCETLSSHGEWELGLSHILALIPGEMAGIATSTMEALDLLAVEFGVTRNMGRENTCPSKT